MFQPEPTAYLHLSTGYAIPQGISNYNFDATPLGLSHDRRSSAPGAGGNAANALLYGSPVFGGSSSCSPGVGPAPPASAPFPFHTSTTSSTAAPASSTPAHNQPPLPVLLKMEQNTDDIIAQQEAARDYQPQLEGPLVGKKTPSSVITEEYAKADPVYIEKTLALPQTYSEYRPILGDGNCGWRAIGFAYFETLIKTRNKAAIDAERVRLEGLNNLLENVGGFAPLVFQDFVQETISLLEKLSGLVGQPEQAMAALEEAFNSLEVSNSIMYHLRMLASSYLKGNRERFAAFITLGTGVDGYCQEVLERHNVEIDHLGVILLVDVLLRDAGFVLEIAYLDRSPGSQVNTYRFPEEANSRLPSELGPIIHLLYRPDHYDILYVPEPSPPVNLQVHRVAGFSQSFDIASSPMAMHGFGAASMQTLSMIPGLGMQAPSMGSVLDTTRSPLAYNPNPMPTWSSTPYVDPLQQAPPPPMPMPGPTTAPQMNPLRFSEWVYADNNTWRREQTLQTSTFKNSHFNTAHYNNPNFQPEEYKGPGVDDRDTPPRGGGRKRGSV